MTATSHVDSEAGPSSKHEERKVLAGTLVGTTIEWYDFFIFAQLTATLLSPLFLAPLNESNPGLAQILSFALIGISFLFRPLGAIIAGHLGDRLGRKAMLVFTLIMMGAATALIGMLPTYAQIGVWAPILLIPLRIIQGFSAGGEWGGAALMAVEHAPKSKRGLFGAYPQIGVPVGMILATGLLYFLNTSMSKEDFAAWGWRVPFLLSIVLIVVGYLIRRAVAESPVFKEMIARKEKAKAPLGELIKHHKKSVLYSTMIFIGNNAAGYLLIAFFISYATKTLKMPVAGDPAGHHAGVLRLADLHARGRLALRQDRPGQDLPDRLRHRVRLDDPDVRPDRHQEHHAVRPGPLRPDHRPRPVVRPDVRHVRRDVPGQRPLLRASRSATPSARSWAARSPPPSPRP